MGEKVGQIAKVSEVKKSSSNSRVRKTERLQSMDTPVDRILFLQRTAGNQAVSRLMRSGALQAKLRIGRPGDMYEQEADRVADEVMRMPEPGMQRQVEEEEEEEETLQTKPLANQITPLVQVQRQEEPEEEEEEMLQAKPLAEEITPLVQRQVEPEEEEEEEEIQPKSIDGTAPEVTPEIGRDIQSIKGTGHPLSTSERAFFEPRFGVDFDDVRVHSDTQAAHVAQSVNARAFTLGRDVVFGARQYSPGTSSSRKLLAHELTHVVQQGGSAGISSAKTPETTSPSFQHLYDFESPTAIRSVKRFTLSLHHTGGGAAAIQRDLVAYNKPRKRMFFTWPYTVTTVTTAEAPGLRSALSTLITAGKVKEVKSKSGKKSWFAANHHRNCKRSDIESAFKAAGYSLATRMARSLYDIHGEYLYHLNKIELRIPFRSYKKTTGPKITTQHSRRMTEYEIRQARRVFRSALNYTKVTIEDGSIAARLFSLGGYARTVGSTIYFPTGKSRDMPFMIHELTHVWQYQKTGITYAVKCLLAQVTAGYSYTPKGVDPNKHLLSERANGKTLSSYNFEQQGDILADYYQRLQRGRPVNGYQPFVNDVK